MNIMDESFLSQLSWDENGMLDTSCLEDQEKRIKLEKPSPMSSPGSPLIAENKVLSNVPTEKVRLRSDPVPAPAASSANKLKSQPQTYQLIKPGPAPSKSSTPALKIQPQISTTTNQMILTQSRPNIITTTPSTIFYNLKTITPGNGQQINISATKSQNQSRTNTPAPTTVAPTIVQPILTFQTADQKPVLLQANPVVYTTTGTDHRTVSFSCLILLELFHCLKRGKILLRHHCQ